MEGGQVKLQARVGPPGCYFWSAIERASRATWPVAQGLLSPHLLFPGQAAWTDNELKMEQLLPKREPSAFSFTLEKL